MTGRERVEALFAADRYAARLGMELIDANPSRIEVRMPIEEWHTNFYDVTHGGALFSLADCAFSLASNAPGDRAVAIDAHLALTSGSSVGDVLTAVAEEVRRGRSIATYLVEVTRQDGRVCGAFTGTVFITPSAD